MTPLDSTQEQQAENAPGHETELTSNPVCPHCGHVERDWWEWNFGAGLEGDHVGDCGSCGEPFNTEREVTVYFTTNKLTATGRQA